MQNTFLFFFRCLLLSFFGFKKEKMSISELFNKFSYRYTEFEQNSFLSPLRYFKTSLILLWKNNRSNYNKNTSLFTYDLLTSFLEGDRDYLTAMGKKNIEFVFRDNLYNELNFYQKTLNSILLIFLLLIVGPIIVFKKDKAKSSLIMLELTENVLLINLLRKYNCKELYIISAFEKDLTFLAYFLQKFDRIKIYLLPSSNPISTLYKKVICDTFIFSAPYQISEYEKLKNNWIIKETLLWPPYGFNSIILNKVQTEPKYLLGIISSGMALRNHLQHTNEYSKDDFLAEEALIHAVKKLQNDNVIEKPIVYLHPLEKSNTEYLDFSKNYYKTIFDKGVDFAPIEKHSKYFFNLCSIAISVYSSTQVERLYGGYKTLFAPMGYLKNFFPDSSFDSISIQNYEDLKQMVSTLLKMGDDEFFSHFKLEEYHWRHYKLN